MKKIFCTAFFCVAVAAGFSQSITGKWKPVLFTLDNTISADVKKDTVVISSSIDTIVKDDKDPAESKNMFNMIAGMMLEKMKVTVEEYTADSVFNNINTSTSQVRKSTYHYDPQKKVLVIGTGARQTTFMVSFTGKDLVLTGEMQTLDDRKGKLVIRYEPYKE